MRITGGEWASRRLAAVAAGSHLRPTPDALREQAFAILSPRLAGSSFLDLFAGTGVNALEALSRGAERAYLVERDAAAAEVIARNAGILHIPGDRVVVVRSDVDRGLHHLARLGVTCKVAWCDPPFATWEVGSSALVSARREGVLVPGAVAVLERPVRRGIVPEGFSELRELRGAVLLHVD